MPESDYYEVLGISKDSSPEAIKKAYRSLARKHHPDVNPGDKTAEKKFKEVQQAYDVLSDPEKRSLYDRYGTAAFEGMAAGPRANASEWSGGFGNAGGYENMDFSDFFANTGGGGEGGAGIFEDLLGRMRSSRGPSRPRGGRSVEANLSIPFLTAVRGGETSINIQRANGRTENLVVKIPPGVDNGSRLRLKGQGEPGPKGGENGDLMITLTVEPHPYFKREDRNLIVEVPISVSEAILGARIDVPSLDGTKSLPIPPGSSSGQKLRLKGQGVPASGGKPGGDLFVQLKIVVPRNIDDASRKLIEQFAEANKQTPRAGLW